MSVPTAVTGWIPNTRINRGVMSDPPPMPVAPIRSPIPSPNTTMIGSMSWGWGCWKRRPVEPGAFVPVNVDRLSPKTYRQHGSGWGHGMASGWEKTRWLAGVPGVRVRRQSAHLLGQLPRGEIGEAHVLEHRPQVGSDRDPDLAQALGGAWVVGRLGRRVLDVGQRALDGPDHVRQGDLLGGGPPPIAAAGAALRPHPAGVLELEQDVLEELQRDALRLRQLLALHRLLVRGCGELERGAHGIVRFGRDPHRGRRTIDGRPGGLTCSMPAAVWDPCVTMARSRARPSGPLDGIGRTARAVGGGGRRCGGRRDGDVADRPRRCGGGAPPRGGRPPGGGGGGGG